MQKRILGYFDGLATAKTTFAPANTATANVHTAKTNKVQSASQTEKTSVSGFYKARKIAVVLMLLVFSVFCAIGSADWIISQQMKIEGGTTSPGETPSQSAFKLDESALQAHIEIAAGAPEATVPSKARANFPSDAASAAPSSYATTNATATPNAVNAPSNGTAPNVTYSAYNGTALTVNLKNQPQNAAKKLVDNASTVQFTTKYITWDGAASLTPDDFTSANAATDGMPTNAGKYAIYVQLVGYTGENGARNLGYAIKYHEIAKCPVEITWVKTTFTYDGTAQKPEYTSSALCGSDKLALTITQGDTEVTEAKNAGTYTATLSASANYALSNNATEFTITKKNVTINWGGIPDGGFTYNGQAQIPTATATGLLNGDTLSVSGAQTDAGTYTATATASANYKITNSTQPFTINRYELIIKWSNTELTYNGEEQNPTATIQNPISGITMPKIYLSASVKNAGTNYPADAHVDDTNYTIKSGASTTFTIKQLNVTLTTLIQKDYDKTVNPNGIKFDSSLITFDNALANSEITVDLSDATANNYISGTASETAGLFSYAYSQDEEVYIKAGSTYLISGVKFSNTANFNITGVSNNTAKIYLKYKTAKTSAGFFTIEDAHYQSGDIWLAGNSIKPDTYVITAFSKLGLQDSSDFKYYKRDYSYSLLNTLIVPHKDNATDKETTEETGTAYGNVYAALVIPQGIAIEATAPIKVTANIGYNQEITTTRAKEHGVLVNNGEITTYSSIDCYGYIKGSGLITLNQNAKMMDVISLYDFPGGTAGSSLKNNVFPSVAFSIHNNACDTKISAGAEYNGYVYVVMSNTGVPAESVPIVGKKGAEKGLFTPTTDNGYILKKVKNKEVLYDIATTNQRSGSSEKVKHTDDIEIFGDFKDNIFNITLQVLFTKVDFNATTDKPIPLGLMNVTVKSGSKLSLTNASYTILPDAVLKVEKGATLSLGSGVNIVAMPKSEMPTSGARVYTKYSKCENDGNLIVNGKLDGSGSLGGCITTEEAEAIISFSNNSALYNVMYDSTKTGYKKGTVPAIGAQNENGDINNLSVATYVSTKSDSGIYYWAGSDRIVEITYNSNGGNLSGVNKKTIVLNISDAGLVPYTLTAEDLIEPTREHYSFDGWYTENTYINKVEPGTTINASITLYAKWKANKYDIIYEYVGCDESQLTSITNTNASQYVYGIGLDLVSPTTTIESLQFAGWYLDEACTKSINTISTTASGVYRLYGRWTTEEPTNYTITLNSGRSDVSLPYNTLSASGTVDSGAIHQLQSITATWNGKKGTLENSFMNSESFSTIKDNGHYNFDSYFTGWNFTYTKNGESYSFNYNEATPKLSIPSGASDIVLTACWTTKAKLLITFRDDKNESISSMSDKQLWFKPGLSINPLLLELIFKSDDFKIIGYNYAKYTVDEQEAADIVFGNSGETTTLVAIYNRKQIKITLSKGTDNSTTNNNPEYWTTKTVYYGDTIELPYTINETYYTTTESGTCGETKYYHVFKGWTYNNKTYSGIITVDFDVSSIVLTGTWDTNGTTSQPKGRSAGCIEPTNTNINNGNIMPIFTSFIATILCGYILVSKKKRKRNNVM